MTEREVFLGALEMATGEERAAYLQGACARDIALRRAVDELLNEHFSHGGPLAGPALGDEQTPAVASVPEDVPGAMLGRYKLLEKVGEGSL